MRTSLHTSLVLLALFSACEDPSLVTTPPLDRLYFPNGLSHLKVAGKTNGVLLVANANSNKLYGTGSVVALDLDAITDLPPMGGTGSIVKITELGSSERQSVAIASFASGVNVVEQEPGVRWRIYVPTRSERNRLYQVDLTFDGATPVLSCVGGGTGQNCVDTGLSLTPREFEFSSTGVPRAPQPYAVAAQVRSCTTVAECCPSNAPDCGRSCSAGACVGRDSVPLSDLWVTHTQQADSPNGTNTNLRSYVVRIESDDFNVTADSFVPIGFGPSNSAVALGPWVYLTGRIAAPSPNLLRMVSRDATTIVSTGLENSFRVSDSRALVLSSNKKRFYMVGRVPDTLLVTNLYNPESALPSVSFARAVPMIDAANEAQVISRAGMGDLVVVSGSSFVGSLAIYDDDLGDVATIINGIGSQPAYIAVDHRGTSARVYVSNFLDGRIAIIDIPDLARPQSARLVGHMGRQQGCLVTGQNSPQCAASGELLE
ncbi:MAG: hypothetical protein DI536_04025 [Archangium gephyra]|uniref:Lipoprotein n=1 Tax=Archangium gephyra TaxID=48 RepID=A0A2W5W2W1_9BACT|nr:MAG: hypothetical protein DI536_04025 [Archangium gephyra]